MVHFNRSNVFENLRPVVRSERSVFTIQANATFYVALDVQKLSPTSDAMFLHSVPINAEHSSTRLGLIKHINNI